MRICEALGLSADYVLFGEERSGDDKLADQIRRIDSRYLPLLEGTVKELLALNHSEQ